MVEKEKKVQIPVDTSKYILRSDVEDKINKKLVMVNKCSGVYSDRPNQRYVEGMKTIIYYILKDVLGKDRND